MAYFIVRPQYKKGVSYILDPVLNNNSWEAIQWAAQQGLASSTWSVGDRKEIILNGRVGSMNFSNQTAQAFIIGFNHNASLEGNNTIHFQVVSEITNNNRYAFCDYYYGRATSDGGLRMQTSKTSSGGWSNSYMRNTLISAFLNAMPSDLQAVLKAVNKYTDNAAGSSHSSSSNVTATQDKVFILSEYEAFGSYTYANSYERNSQKQYDFYKTNTKYIYRRESETSSSTCYWWLRSPSSTQDYYYCYVSSTSNAGHGQANYSYGLVPAFVVG